HLFDDLVGVAVGHEASERAATGHAEAARIIDDDQVDLSGFFALGGKACASAAADDGEAAVNFGAQTLENCGAILRSFHNRFVTSTSRVNMGHSTCGSFV